MSKPSVHVAIALLFHHGKVLVGWRNAEQHQGNKYEFPGGKVEQGETPAQACRREVFEEVGVDIQNWHVFDVIHHEYEDIEVFLHLFHTSVDEECLIDIQRPWTWYNRDQLLDLNFPKANQSIIERLHWSHHIKISAQLSDLDLNLTSQLFYWRVTPSALVAEQLKQLQDDAYTQLILNIELWQLLSENLQKKVSAVHFKHHQLMQLKHGDLPTGIRCIAACHDVVSLQYAQNLGFDAVMLSPVLKTASHPDAQVLGWDLFKQYCNMIDIPVFALGGLVPSDLAIAQQHGAYGVAGVSHF